MERVMERAKELMSIAPEYKASKEEN